MSDISTFINDYTEKYKDRIEFKSNDLEHDDWKDINSEYRDEISNEIFSNSIKAPELLIKDLFRAEAAYSRESWGSSRYLSKLGALLLSQTNEKYIEDYFLGKEESFDTQCAVSLGDVGEEKLRTIVKNLKKNDMSCTEGEFEMDEVIEFIEEYVDEHY